MLPPTRGLYCCKVKEIFLTCNTSVGNPISIPSLGLVCHIEIDHINFEWPRSSNKEAVGYPVVQTSVGWHKNKWTEAHFHETLRIQVDSYFKGVARTHRCDPSLYIPNMPGFAYKCNFLGTFSRFCIM